jgi:hypothetical protein
MRPGSRRKGLKAGKTPRREPRHRVRRASFAPLSPADHPRACSGTAGKPKPPAGGGGASNSGSYEASSDLSESAGRGGAESGGRRLPPARPDRPSAPPGSRSAGCGGGGRSRRARPCSCRRGGRRPGSSRSGRRCGCTGRTGAPADAVPPGRTGPPPAPSGPRTPTATGQGSHGGPRPPADLRLSTRLAMTSGGRLRPRTASARKSGRGGDAGPGLRRCAPPGERRGAPGCGQ